MTSSFYKVWSICINMRLKCPYNYQRVLTNFDYKSVLTSFSPSMKPKCTSLISFACEVLNENVLSGEEESIFALFSQYDAAATAKQGNRKT